MFLQWLLRSWFFEQYNSLVSYFDRKFYALSKTYHPDHNRDDDEASNRFIQVSEAYAILGIPEKRHSYDLSMRRTSNKNLPTLKRYPDVNSCPYGSRPASGLSRRSAQFRGPQASLYRSGECGTARNKRKAQVNSVKPVSTHSGTPFDAAKTNKGQPTEPHYTCDHDVPHFDEGKHNRTQKQQELRKNRRTRHTSTEYVQGGSLLINFMLVVGTISFAFYFSSILNEFTIETRKL